MREQRIVVSGFLLHEGKVLLVRRALHERAFAGKWELPGGKVEFNEDPCAALVREFMEETGIAVRVGAPYATQSYLIHNNERHAVEILYKVAADDVAVTLSDDHDAFAWASRDELERYDITPEMRVHVENGFDA